MPVFALAGSLLLLAGTSSLQAANILKSDTTTMSAAADWSGTAPTSASVGEFGSIPSATSLANMTLGASITLGGLQFDGTGATPMAGPLTITDANTLSLSSSGMTMQTGAPAVTLACPVNPNKVAQTWTVPSGCSLTISGAISAGSETLTVVDNGTMVMPSYATGGSATGGFIISGAGTYTGTDINIGRAGTTYGPTAPTPSSPYLFSTTAGFYVNGPTMTLTTLELGQANAGGYGRIDSGSVTVSGQVLCGNSSTTRWNGLAVNGGTFTSSDTVNGIVISKNLASTSAAFSELYAAAGTINANRIAYGASTDTIAATGVIIVGGGTLYVGSGGIVKATPIGAFSATTYLNNGTLGALGNWSSSLPMQLSGPAGTPFVIQTADASANPHNITLTGALSSTGSITATGGGVLTLGGVNTYAGTTAINGGTVNAGVADVPGTSGPFGKANTAASITFGGGTLQYSSLNNHDYSPRFSTAGSQPISIDTAAQNVTFGTAIVGTGTTLALQDSVGTGSLTLSVANTYTGNTTITSGTLQLGASGTTGSGNVALNGGTLTGTGTVAGTVTVATGGVATVVPGTSGAGVLTVGGLTLGNGASVSFVPGGDSITAGTLTLNGSPGTAFTLLTAGGSPFTTAGTYTLINYATEAGSDTVGSDATWTTPSGSNPHVANPQFGLTYSFVDTGTRIQLVIGSTLTSGTWNGSASDNLWSDAVNWTDSSGSGAPNGVGASATFDNGSATTMGPITLGGATTVGSITFNNAASYVIASDGNTLTLDDNGSGATLIVTGGSANQINDAVSLSDNVTATVSVGDALTIGGAIANTAGSKQITVNGQGALYLNNANAYGPAAGSVGTVLGGSGGALLGLGNNTSLGSGDLSVTANDTLQDPSPVTAANNIKIGSGVTLTLDNAGSPFSLTGVISGATGTIMEIGSGSLTLGSANTYGGGSILTAGTLDISADGAGAGNAGSLGVVPAAATPNNIILNGGDLVGTAALTLHANRGIGIGPTPITSVGTYTAKIDNTSGGTLTVNGVIASAGNAGTDNLTINGSGGTGIVALGGANTFAGTAVIGAGTLQLNNANALQSAILNYSSGTLSFGTLTSATIGEFMGSQSLALQNNATAAVALTTGGNGASWTYAGALSGPGSFTKAGTGTLTLTGNNSYAGTTTAGAGTLAVSTGGVINNSSPANCNGGELLVNGGSLSATTGDVAGTLAVSSGTATYSGGLTTGSASGSYSFLVTGGTLQAATFSPLRGTSTYSSAQTAGGTTDCYVNGAGALLNITGAATLTTDSSSVSLRIDEGSATIGGVLTIECGTAGRWSLTDVNGGTLTVSDPTTGIDLGGSIGGGGELLVRAGTATAPIITCDGGSGAQSAIELIGTGTLYVGAGGIIQAGSIVPAITLGGTATLAATAPWSSSLAMSLTGTPNTIQAADSTGTAHNITLSGVLSGGGALTKTGAGTLTLNAADTLGNIIISAGTLALGTGGSIAGSSVSLAGGATFDVSAVTGGNYTMGGTSFTASGDAPAVLNIALGGTVNNSLPTTLTLTSVGGAIPNPALSVTGGTLVFNDNQFTINGPLLPPGIYTLVNASGTGAIGYNAIAGDTFPAPTGTAIGWPGTTAPTITVSGSGSSAVLALTISDPNSCVGGLVATNGTWTRAYSSVDANDEQLSFGNTNGIYSVVGYNMVNCTFSSGTATVYGGGTVAVGPGTPYLIGLNAGSSTSGTATVLPVGTTNLVLIATQTTQGVGQTARVNALVVADGCSANTMSFDPISANLYLSQSGEVRVVFNNISQNDKYVNLQNGTPGLRSARIIVNGTVFALNGLANGASQSVDISSALKGGTGNTVVVEGFGSKGAGAVVSIGETPAAPASGSFQVSADSAVSTFINLPALQITQSGDQTVLSWPATGPAGEDFTAYQLQTSASGLPGSWSVVGTAPVNAGGQLTVTVTAGGSAQFYQLADPTAQ